MARIGMIYAVYAPFQSHADGSAPVYGTGKNFIHAIAATIAQTRQDNKLYGDDIGIERDNSLTDIRVTFEGDQLMPEDRVGILGDVKNGDDYEVVDSSAPYVGFGYVRKVMKDGVVSFETVWIYKTQFGVDTEEDNTKGESITWGTAKLSGVGECIYNDNTGMAKAYRYAAHATEAAAKAWLNALANITA